MHSQEHGGYQPLEDRHIDNPEEPVDIRIDDPERTIQDAHDLVRVKQASPSEMPTLRGTLEQTEMTPEERLLHLREKKKRLLTPLRELQNKYKDQSQPNGFRPLSPEDRAAYLRLDSQIKKEIASINKDIDLLLDFTSEEPADKIDENKTLAA